MTSNELREKFMDVLKREFPAVIYKKRNLKSGYIRYSLYVPDNNNKKRWMQLDANTQYLSIAMDHNFGEIKKDDLVNLGLKYGLNSSCNAIHLRKSNDAVNISIFINEPYDFTKEVFLRFFT
ncbi:hypothetical protein [Solibacillus isronensis]|uniref:hypothetical protein n=1 Tax=Solibacillus isronensis TaxID=412383 RepID=UPI00203F98FC|nr:hypothetical protein [Solibacillus isronensis]MCM3721560.1 hypothetical protein [Solibacillus isronensis]